MSRRTGCWASLAIALTLAVPAAGADDAALLRRIERLEAELEELKAELRAREAPPATSAPAAAPAPPPAAAAPPPAPPSPEEVALAPEEHEADRLRRLLDRIQLGGYGSVRFEDSSLENQNATFTYRRFVLTTDANIAPRLRAYMELELERFHQLELEKALGEDEGGLGTEQTVEGTNESEISLEQAWLQYDVMPWLKLRGGGVLVPLGRFNLNHDDDRWDLPRRSLVDRGVPVLPAKAAWDEVGGGFLGDLDLGDGWLANYQVYVMNGVALDFEFEQIAQTRSPEPGRQVIEVKLEPATGTFGNDVKDAKAVAGRLALSPLLGHELAGSWYVGQYTPDFLGKENLWSLALDGATGHGPFELEGEFVFTRFENIEDVARKLASVAVDRELEAENGELESVVEYELSGLARSKYGYWLDLRYRFWPDCLTDTFLGWRFENPQLVAVVRGEQVWFDDLLTEADFGGGRLTVFDTEARRVDRITTGLSYRPVPLVTFQLAYEYTHTDSGKSLAGVTNFLPAQADENTAHAVLFGTAFGF